MTNDFLKTVMLLVIVLCVVGVIFWLVSERYPAYAAKREVQQAMKDFCNAIKRYGSEADRVITADYLITKEWVTLDKETKRDWTFELYGDPPTLIIAQSTPSMVGGRDKIVKCDIASGSIWGWGTGIGEDSTAAMPWRQEK